MMCRLYKTLSLIIINASIYGWSLKYIFYYICVAIVAIVAIVATSQALSRVLDNSIRALTTFPTRSLTIKELIACIIHL